MTVCVCAGGKPLTLPTRTAYKAFSNRWNWNEWLQLPIHYKDVPRSAVLALEIYDIYGPRKAALVGSTTIPIFGSHGCLRRGIHDLRVWLGVEPDGSLSSATPGEMDEKKESEMMRLAKLVKKHRKGRMMRVDWLDRLTYREIEVINEREKRSTNCMYLTIEFPTFHCDNIEHRVVFYEVDGDLKEHYPPKSEFLMVNDPEWNLENLVELKHHRLTHSLREGAIARELKPNARTRDHIMKILNYPPTHELLADEKSLIWQFRYYLTQERKALAKFVQSIDWQSKQEADEAVELMYRWQPLDTTDALELLTREFKDPRVRKYAISRLQCADNDELLLYLLQVCIIHVHVHVMYTFMYVRYVVSIHMYSIYIHVHALYVHVCRVHTLYEHVYVHVLVLCMDFSFTYIHNYTSTYMYVYIHVHVHWYMGITCTYNIMYMYVYMQLVQALRYESPDFIEHVSEDEEEVIMEEKTDLSLDSTYSEGITCNTHMHILLYI